LYEIRCRIDIQIPNCGIRRIETRRSVPMVDEFIAEQFSCREGLESSPAKLRA